MIGEAKRVFSGVRRSEAGMRALRLALAANTILAGALVSGAAIGQEASWLVNPGLQDRWTLEIGAYSPTVDTTAHLNGPLGNGTTVNFEEDLNLKDRKTSATILGKVRIGDRWRIEAEYFGLDRSGSRSINRTITWGDDVYPIGITVSSTFDTDIFRLSGGYSFVKNDTAEVGIALGLHATDFRLSLGATGVGSQQADALAPLPTVGLYASYALSPRWLISGRVDYFSLDYDEYDGSLVAAQGGIDYRFTRNFGIGLGYRYIDYDLTVTKARFNGGVEYRFSGPVLYLVGSF